MTQEELRARIEDWRAKAVRGELTLEECKEIVAYCREHRGKTQPRPAPAGGKTSPVSTPRISADDLLKGLL